MKKFYSFSLLFFLPLSLFSQNWEWVGHVTSADSVATEVVAIDLNDNVIIGGLRRGTIEFVGSSGPVTMTSSTAVNSPFIAKYDSNGNLLWANALGGNDASNLKDIITDNNGNIYAVGSFRGTDYVFRSQDGNDQTLTSGGLFDPYLLKFDPNGNLLLALRFASSTGTVRTQNVILDNSDNIILSGFFTSGSLDFGGGTSFDFSGANNNGYLAKFDNDGTLIWAKHFPGNWARLESGLAICQTEGFFATITIRTSVTIEGFGTINSTNGTGYEMIFTKFNNDGVAQWIRHATSNSDTYGGNFITSDEDGNSYFTGRFSGTISFPNPPGDPVNLTSTGSYDSFIAKYSKNGELLSATKWGGTGAEWNYGINYQDNIIINTGFYSGTMILNAGTSADTLVSNGNRDAYLISFDKDLNYLSSTSVGGTLNDDGISVAFDSAGNPVFGGYFFSPTIDFGLTQLINGSGTNKMDLFLAKFIDVRIIATATPASCFEGSDGIIEFTISGGGTPPINYTVHLGNDLIASGTYSSAVNLNGLSAGTYKIAVTDSNGNTREKYIEVTQPAQLTANIDVTNITSCYGNAEGQITISGASGGYGTYDYSINAGADWQSSNIFENLVAGIYHVMIRDAGFPSCERTLDENVEITQTAEIIISVNSTDITCHGSTDGIIEITASGGTGELSYSINNGVDWQAGNGLFTGLAAGNYNIRVKDVNDCETVWGSNPVEIIEPVELVISLVEKQDITCFGASDGSITITATGGTGELSYSINNGIDWQAGNGLFTGLDAGNYNIRVKDINDCETAWGTNPVEIIEPVELVISLVEKQDITCFGETDGTITVTAAGGTGELSYSINNGIDWQAGNGLFTGLDAGNYNIRVKDINDCETVWGTNPVEIIEPVELVISIVEKQDITCFGDSNGTITVTAAGGTGELSYSINNGVDWQAGNGLFTGLDAGNYNIRVKDVNDCETAWGTNPVEIIEPVELVISLVEKQDITCFGALDGRITITATGGTGILEYSLNGTSWQTNHVFTGLASGTYQVFAKDENNCNDQWTTDIVIIEPPEIIITVSPTNISCHDEADGKIEINATGGYGGPYQYSINNGVSFQSSNTFTNLPPDTYRIKVSDGICIKSGGIVNIVNPDPITASVLAEDISCFGLGDGKITITNVAGGSGSYEYSINGIHFFENGGLFTSLQAGDYELYIMDSYGCTVQLPGTYTITEPTPVQISNVISQEITSCHGNSEGSITIEASGGTGDLSYTINNGVDWQLADGSFTGLPAGSYNIQVKDVNNCEIAWNSNPLIISQPDEIIITDVEEQHISCFGESDGKIIVTATGGTGVLEFSLNGTDWQASNVFENLAKDTYLVFVKDANACNEQWDFDVEISEPAQLSASEPTILPENLPDTYGSISITALGGTSPYTYTLNPGEISNQTGNFTGLTGGDYTIEIIDSNGCIFITSTLTVSIDRVESVPEEGLRIFPNPSNGQFIVEFKNQLNKELYLRIYNVVGQVVYTYKVNPIDTFIKQEINLENEAKGVYMLQISGADARVTRKLIIR